jgi:hypothetical protein
MPNRYPAPNDWLGALASVGLANNMTKMKGGGSTRRRARATFHRLRIYEFAVRFLSRCFRTRLVGLFWRF